MSPAPRDRGPRAQDGEKPNVRTHTPRPDTQSRETFEFIAAVDGYKRRHMRSFLSDAEVLEVFLDLGYRAVLQRDGRAKKKEALLRAFADARQRYRVEQGRLFPTWSEIFELLLALGFERRRRDNAA
jgi:hypothetical protein